MFSCPVVFLWRYRLVGCVCVSAKVRFILAVVERRLEVSNRKKAELLSELKREGYDLFMPA